MEEPFIEVSDMIHGAPLRGWSGRYFHSQNMTFAHWDIAADAADLHEHAHPQEEVWHIVEGEVMLVIDGRTRALGPGAAAVVPPNVPHSATVIAACHAIVTDYPLRHELPGVRTS